MSEDREFSTHHRRIQEGSELMSENVESADERYRLIVAFPDGSPSFVHGYEAGKLGYRMQFTAEQTIEEMVHTANEEVLRRMAVAYGWSAEFEISEIEEWTTVRLTRLPAKKHLAVVK